MNSPARVRAILATVSGKSGSQVSVLPHGAAATITGTLGFATVPGDGGLTNTVLTVAPASGPVWQFDPAWVSAVAV